MLFDINTSNNSGTFSDVNDDVELFGVDSVIGKAVQITYDGPLGADIRVACGQIEVVDCSSLDSNLF